MLFGYFGIFLSVLLIIGYEGFGVICNVWFDVDFVVFEEELVLLVNL